MLNQAGRAQARPISGHWVIAFKCVFIAAVLLVTHESLIPAGNNSVPNNWDKLVHFIAYFVLSVMALFAFPHARLLWIVMWLTILGIGIEIAQALMPFGRSGSFADGVANMLGALLPAGLWQLYNRAKT